MEKKCTATELLTKAMAIMGETEGYKSGYLPFLVELVNQLLADCFAINNAVREEAGKAPLISIPWISAEEDAIVYEIEIVTNVMVYGLAFWLLFQDDENDKANVCNAAYETNKTRAAKAVYTPAEDAYR